MSGFSSSKEDAISMFEGFEAGGLCAYPSCRRGLVTAEAPYVRWEGDLYLPDLYKLFPPVVKLAIESSAAEGLTDYKRIRWPYFIHPECAAEWGMHLIRDALEADDKVGRKLRHAKKPKEQYNEF